MEVEPSINATEMQMIQLLMQQHNQLHSSIPQPAQLIAPGVHQNMILPNTNQNVVMSETKTRTVVCLKSIL